MARLPSEFWDTVYDDTSTPKTQWGFAWARDLGRTIGVDMVDETDLIWGYSPTPGLPPFAAPMLSADPGRWSVYSPPLGDDAVFRFMDKINAVTNRPKITWPVLGLDYGYHTPHDANWMADPRFSDYATVYVTPLGGLSFPDRQGLDAAVHVPIDVSLDWAQFNLRRNRPMLVLTGFTGPAYQKLVPGFTYQPGKDKIQNVGSYPLSVAASVNYAAIRGAAGTRTYFAENDPTPGNILRTETPIGSGGVQVGANPFFIGVDRWRAYASACKFLRTLEPYLLNAPQNAPDLGYLVRTTVRSSTAPGNAGNLLMAINFSEGPQTVAVDVSSYLYTSSSYFTRYYQQANLDSQEGAPYTSLTHGATDTITLQGGETVAWVFKPNQGAPNTVPPDAPSGLTANATSWITVSLTWTETNNNNDPDPIKDYLVFRNGVQVAVATSTAFVDGGLTGSTTYFYQVKARDTDGNVSGLSNAAWTTTLVMPDLFEPWITNVQVSSITATTAIVTWTTDKLADSHVIISTYPAANINEFGTDTNPDLTMTLNHSIILTNLARGTVYYFFVTSRAQSNGLRAISENYSFTTLFDGPIIGAIRIAGGNGSGFVDKSSHTWISDRYFDQGGFGQSLIAGTTIQNTTDPEVYWTRHAGQLYNYNIPLANGYYNVKLKFVETQCLGTDKVYFSDSIGCRIFDVSMDGQKILPALDIYKVAPGSFTAYDWSYPTVYQVTRNEIQFNFAESTTDWSWGLLGGAVVSGIEIVLNCSDSTTIPTPQLNLPQYLPVNSTIQFKYDPTCNIDHFDWSMAEQSGSIGSAPAGPSGGAAAAPAFSRAFATRAPTGDLAPQSVPPGYYRIGVKAVSDVGTPSQEGVAYVQLIGDQLGNARVYPNPWRVDKPNNGVVTFDFLTVSTKVRIFDVAGHHVRTLPPTGTGTTTWDLKNEGGQGVASGIYLYLLTDDNGQKATGKLVVIR